MLYSTISLFCLRNTIVNDTVNKISISILIKSLIIMFYRWYGMILSNITHEEFLDGARK